MDKFKPPSIRPLAWLGNSKKVIQSFPKGVQKLIGDELQLIQFGRMPKDAKPFKGVGGGVFEIAIVTPPTPIAPCWPSSLARRSTSCTSFRKNPSAVLLPPGRTLS